MGVLDLFRLDGRVALVTGGGQGIGRAFALALAEAGADVVVADINERTASLVANEVESLGKKALFVRTDVGDAQQIEAMVVAALNRFGHLDVAVNNAFAARGGRAEQTSSQDWDLTLSICLRAVFLCCRAEVQPMIQQQRGKIINMASISGTIANAGIAYNTAKAGVIMLTRSLAAEWGKYNINVNSISPCYTLSPAHRRTPRARRDQVRSLHPMGWFERPEDLCGTLIYLASDASNYVTGRDHIVDGGHTLNVWLDALPRVAPPLVSREEEVRALKHDLDVLGIKYDEDVVTAE